MAWSFLSKEIDITQHSLEILLISVRITEHYDCIRNNVEALQGNSPLVTKDKLVWVLNIFCSVFFSELVKILFLCVCVWMKIVFSAYSLVDGLSRQLRHLSISRMKIQASIVPKMFITAWNHNYCHYISNKFFPFLNSKSSCWAVHRSLV